MLRNTPLYTTDEMPATTRACHGMAMVLGLLSGCELIARGLPTIHHLHAVVSPEAINAFLPTVYLAVMSGALVGLGCVVQRLFERRRHRFAGARLR